MRACSTILRSLLLIFAINAVVMAVAGCASSKRPSLMVEVCLKDAAGISAFKAEMKAIARSSGMTLVDDSPSAERNVDAITNPEFRTKVTRPVVSMILNHEDKTIVIAGNIGLPSGQVAIGFFDGLDSLDTHRFAETVVQRLATRWRVEKVPEGRGAQGMKGCTES